MTSETDEPPSPASAGKDKGLKSSNAPRQNGHPKPPEDDSLIGRIKALLRPKTGTEHLREALEEYIEELEDGDEQSSIASHEKILISNVLKIRDLTVIDVMVPRADIVAVEINSSEDDLLSLLSEKQYSRLPVYRETLDNIIGTVHIKDILANLATKKDIKIPAMVRDIAVVSPSMDVLDLLLQFKQTKKHMVLVADEFGGIDGLATIGDVIEAITGEIDDEFDQDVQPQIEEKPDGSLIADGRVDIDEFEERFGQLLNEEEREDIDTLGGLVFSIAGRVPARGEVLTHESGMVFEIMDADPRRVNRVRIKNIPTEAA